MDMLLITYVWTAPFSPKIDKRSCSYFSSPEKKASISSRNFSNRIFFFFSVPKGAVDVKEAESHAWATSS